MIPPLCQLPLAGLGAVAIATALCAAASAQTQPTAHFAARLLPVDAPPIDDGVLVTANGKITALGPRRSTAIPADAVRVDHGDLWLSPGFVDLHHHVSGGGGDINDMVLPTNAELRTLDVVKPSEEMIARACAGGVTTTLFIPGSGTNLGGFGVLLKMLPDGPFEAMVVRELGAMKVAQGVTTVEEVLKAAPPIIDERPRREARS